MQAFDLSPVLDRTHDAPGRASAPTFKPLASPARGGSAWVLALQRSAGNATVSRLLASVQRCGDHIDPGCACADQLLSSDIDSPVVARQGTPPVAPPAGPACLPPGSRRAGNDADSVDQALQAGCLDEAFPILWGHAMYGLLTLLDALRSRSTYALIRANAAGRGGPRLLTAIHAVDLRAAGPINGPTLRGLVDEMSTLPPDQRGDILRFLGMSTSVTVQGLVLDFSYVAGAAGKRSCKDAVSEAAKFDLKMKVEYEACRGKPGIKNSDDVEACVNGSLAKQGVSTSVGGTTSQSGTVVVNVGAMTQCQPIRVRHHEIHEGVHASTQKKLEKKHGAGTAAMDAAWTEPNGWIDDEKRAYQAGYEFYKEVIAALTLLEGKVPK